MLVKFTAVKGGLPIYLEHSMIKLVERTGTNPLTTTIMTSFMTPQGPLAYEVTESTSLCADAINEAHRSNTPSSLITH